MSSTVPVVGSACPICHYTPLHEDGGMICCFGCDAKWDATGKAEDWEEEPEDKEE